jgi:hypothetical protein
MRVRPYTSGVSEAASETSQTCVYAQTLFLCHPERSDGPHSLNPFGIAYEGLPDAKQPNPYREREVDW